MENQHVLDSFKNIMDIIDICENVSTDFAREARVEHASEYLMDASVIKMSHDLMGRFVLSIFELSFFVITTKNCLYPSSMTEKMSNNDFREDEYIASLIQMITTDENHLVEIAVKCCRTAKFQLSVLGAFDFDADPRPEIIRKERQRAQKNLNPKETPENVKQIVKVDRGAEKINIMRSEIQRVCQQRNTDAIPYFEVIIDPHNFMKSIDAAFQISFLVRDGIIGIKRINNEPHIFVQNQNAAHNSRGNIAEDTIQAVMSLDPQTWKEEIKKYKLKASLLKLDSANTSAVIDSDSD